MKILHTADPGEGGDPLPPQNPPPNANTESQPPPAPPPAATVVLNGGKSERESELEAQLESEKAERKQRELRVNELENENRQLKQVTAPPLARKRSRFLLLEDDE